VVNQGRAGDPWNRKRTRKIHTRFNGRFRSQACAGSGRADLPREISASVTLAALVIPLNIGYAQVAGLPATMGLYAAIVPLVLFALFTYGVTNAAAGFTGSMVCGNSVSRTAALDSAGAQSQLTSLVATVVVAAILLFFTDVLALLPNAALAGIVANAVLSLVKISTLRIVDSDSASSGSCSEPSAMSAASSVLLCTRDSVRMTTVAVRTISVNSVADSLIRFPRRAASLTCSG